MIIYKVTYDDGRREWHGTQAAAAKAAKAGKGKAEKLDTGGGKEGVSSSDETKTMKTKMTTILRIIDETMESIMEMVREENDADLAEETHALLNRMRRDIKEEVNLHQ